MFGCAFWRGTTVGLAFGSRAMPPALPVKYGQLGGLE